MENKEEYINAPYEFKEWLELILKIDENKQID